MWMARIRLASLLCILDYLKCIARVQQLLGYRLVLLVIHTAPFLVPRFCQWLWLHMFPVHGYLSAGVGAVPWWDRLGRDAGYFLNLRDCPWRA